jgi:hypothetical protein
MNAMLAGQKQRWTVAVAGGVSIMMALLFLFRLPPPPVGLSTPEPSAAGSLAKPAVQLAKPNPADQLLKDETEIRDLRPLFLPTDRNAALPDLKREPGRTFLDNQTVKLSFLETELGISRDLPPVATVSGKPADQATPLDALVSETSAISLFGFGRVDSPVQPLAPRVGFVEVLSADDGKRVFGESLGAEARVPGDKPWAPLEFFARINAAGLAAPLFVTTSSGVDEVDRHFREFLAKTYRLGERLSPGFYRVIVAP